MVLTNEQVIDIANHHGLKIQAESLKSNESGLDFQVVFAKDLEGERWVLRFPRREDVLPKAKKEKQILDLIEPRVLVQVPVWEVFSDELIAYRLLEGIPTGTIDTDAEVYVWEIDEKDVPDMFHDTLARALVSLHQIDHEEARKSGLSVLAPEELKSSMKERMEKVKTAFGVDEALWSRWQAWLANESLWPKQTALIHGDLHAGHILIDHEARVTGVIDWTEARVDDPAHDFGAHLTLFGEEALKELLQSYQNTGGYVWNGMFEHIIELVSTYPVAIAEFAITSGLKEYEDMAKQMLGVEDK